MDVGGSLRYRSEREVRPQDERIVAVRTILNNGLNIRIIADFDAGGLLGEQFVRALDEGWYVGDEARVEGLRASEGGKVDI